MSETKQTTKYAAADAEYDAAVERLKPWTDKEIPRSSRKDPVTDEERKIAQAWYGDSHDPDPVPDSLVRTTILHLICAGLIKASLKFG